MNKRKTGKKKAGTNKKNPAKRAAKPRAKAPRGTKTVTRKAPRKKVVGRKAQRTPPSGRPRGSEDFMVDTPGPARGLGAEAGGQSGDTEGLSRTALADSESVEELIEEGQAFEAGVISGIENAPDADKRGVRTRQVPQDDVPEEYLDKD